MDNVLNKLALYFENIPDTLRKYRWLVWLFFIASSVMMMAGMSRFSPDLSLEAYLQDEDPTKQAYDRFRTKFGSDVMLRVVYKAKDGDVFSDNSLRAIAALQDELTNYRLKMKPGEFSQLDRIVSVRSLINIPYIDAYEGSINSQQLVGSRFPTSETERELLRKRTLNHPDYPLRYASKDSSWGAMMVRTDIGAVLDQDIVVAGELSSNTDSLNFEAENEDGLDQEFSEIDFDDINNLQQDFTDQPPKYAKASSKDYSEFWHAIRPILIHPKYTDHLSFHPVGGPPLLAYMEDSVRTELKVIFLLCVTLVAGVLWFLFRSFSAIFWPMSVVFLSFFWVVGAIGWTGVLMTQVVNIILMLVLAVGVADSIHILSGYLFFRQQNMEHKIALRAVYKKSGLACFLTSITTAIGLLSLTLIPIIPIRNFGIFAAMGVMLAFFFTIFLLPLMLDLWSPYSDRRQERKTGKKHLIQHGLQKVESLSFTYPKTIIAIFSLITLIFSYGASQIFIDSNMVKTLEEDSTVRKNFQLVDDNMSGSGNLEIMVEAGKPNAIKDPEVLNKMDELQTYLEEIPDDLISLTQSVVNLTKITYKALHDDDPAMFKIPQDPRVLEQTLFVFNNANSEERRRLVSDDYSAARITVMMKAEGTHTYAPINEQVQVKIDELFGPLKAKYPDLKVTLTGRITLAIALGDYITRSQIESFGVALLIISVIVCLLFSSKRVGLIAMFPNLFPIIVGFGTMGFLGMPLDATTLLIAPVIIGIVVDDTIHFLTHYRAGMIEHGNIPDAIKSTIREAGQAITFTSVVLSLGFLIYITSPNNSMQSFGVVSALAICVAFIADILLLPALCAQFKVDFKKSKGVEDLEPQTA